jgi:uncharacterized membrane protein YfcA
MNGKMLQIITRVGMVIITTLSTFIIAPPAMNPDENSGVNWKNIFIFFAGIFSILLYDRKKKNIRSRNIGFWLLGFFILLIGLYEFLISKYAVRCFGQLCVVSYSNFKDSKINDNFLNWKNNASPFGSLLEVHNCNPLEVWDMSSLIPAYYGILGTYFSIIIAMTLLLTFLSDKIHKNEFH